MMKKIIIMLMILVLFNCQNKNESGDYQFEKINIRGQLLPIRSADIPDPWLLLVIDTLLVISNSPNDEHQFTIINLKNNKLVKHFGTRGRGPGELVSSFMFSKSRKRRCFETYSINLLQVQRINVDSVLKGKNPYHEVIATFKANKDKANPKNFFWPLRAKCVNKNLFITCDFFHENKLFGLCDNQGNILGTYLNYPDVKKLPFQVKKMKLLVYKPLIEMHPKDNRFVYACRRSDWLVIGDATTKGIKNLYNQYSFLPKSYIRSGLTPVLKIDRSSIQGNYGLVTSEDYIFVQKSYKTVTESISGNRIELVSNIIYVYDWNGKMKYQLVLDRKISYFTIDEHKKVLYALTNHLEPVIIKYNLEQIL